MPSGIDLLTEEHATVNDLFAEFEQTGQGALVGQIVDALTGHDSAEHAALYPMVAELVGDAAMVARCDEAHQAIKRQMDLVKGLEGPPLVAAVQQLRSLVTRHVADEEGKVFPALAAVATPDQLDILGARLLQAKQRGG